MTDVFLCRHGRTNLNAAGLLRGHLDPHLDAVGRAEAHNLAVDLGRRDIRRIISSPLSRAIETATPLASILGLTIETDERFADRQYGEFNGTSAADIIARYGSLDAAPGVESADSVAGRASDLLEELILTAEPGPLAIVTHDAVIRLLLERLIEPPVPEVIHPQTGSWCLLRHDQQGWSVIGGSADICGGRLERKRIIWNKAMEPARARPEPPMADGPYPLCVEGTRRLQPHTEH